MNARRGFRTRGIPGRTGKEVYGTGEMLPERRDAGKERFKR